MVAPQYPFKNFPTVHEAGKKFVMHSCSYRNMFQNVVVSLCSFVKSTTVPIH